MEEPRLFADHLGIYTIMPPKDMPLAVIAMLQETIKEAWADYDGDPYNPEEFWAHLAMGEAVPTSDEVEGLLQEAKSRAGSVDVPRETFDELLDQSTLGSPAVEAIRKHALWAHNAGGHGRIMEFLAESDRVVAEQGADVPRETSPSVEDRFPCLVDVVYQVNGGEHRTAQRKVMARDALEAIAQVRAGLVAAFKNENINFVLTPDVRWVPDGGRVVADVPRETSRGDSD